MTRFRYVYLLAALVLAAFVKPFLENAVIAPAIIDLIVFVSLIAGAYVATKQKVYLVPVVTLGFVSAILQAVYAITDTRGSATAFVVCATLYYAVVAWAILSTLLSHQRRVTSDTLCQAVSVFLLLGLLWAMAYALLEIMIPGSFRFDGAETGEQAQYDRFVGFSFTTLTTLGYGNISPATPRADALANSQAITGQVYIAVVIARLVAIQLAQSLNHNEEKD